MYIKEKGEKEMDGTKNSIYDVTLLSSELALIIEALEYIVKSKGGTASYIKPFAALCEELVELRDEGATR